MGRTSEHGELGFVRRDRLVVTVRDDLAWTTRPCRTRSGLIAMGGEPGGERRLRAHAANLLGTWMRALALEAGISHPDLVSSSPTAKPP